MLSVDLTVPVHRHGSARFRAAVPPGSALALFGPSGSGKTTFLRALLGLHPARGRLSWAGRELSDRPVHGRPFAWVPQDPSLFPHWTLGRQMAEARGQGVDAGRLAEIFRALGLDGLEDRPGRSLSGGQQQRGALARALARDAAVLLLDEPFSALDEPTRRAIGDWLRAETRSRGTAMVMASHDWHDVEAWADRVLMLDRGRVVAEGAPRVLFLKPPNWAAASLLGYEARVGPYALHPDLATFRESPPAPMALFGVVAAVGPYGAGFRVRLTTEDGLTVTATGPPGHPWPTVGSTIRVGFDAPEVGDE